MKKLIVGIALATTISSTLGITNAEAHNFTDVKGNMWYTNAVNEVSELGYVTGYPDGTFRGEKTVTRAEAVVVINNYLKAQDKLIGKTGRKFSDVPADTWYSEAVSNVSAEGIVKGKGHAEFKPQDTLTRAELAVIVTKLNGSTKTFKDVPVNAWSFEYVNKAYESGLMSGMGVNTGMFNPTGKVTRYQLIQTMSNILNYDPSYVAPEIVIPKVEEPTVEQPVTNDKEHIYNNATVTKAHNVMVEAGVVIDSGSGGSVARGLFEDTYFAVGVDTISAFITAVSTQAEKDAFGKIAVAMTGKGTVAEWGTLARNLANEQAKNTNKPSTTFQGYTIEHDGFSVKVKF